MNLADALVPRTYTDGDTIIKQGDAADGKLILIFFIYLCIYICYS